MKQDIFDEKYGNLVMSLYKSGTSIRGVWGFIKENSDKNATFHNVRNYLKSPKQEIEKNVLVIGDLHEPFGKKGYLDFVKGVYDKYNCNEVVFIGDIIDNHYSSFHDTDPDGHGGKMELEQAIKCLEPFYKTFPKAKVCIGNHDNMLRRKAFSNNIPSAWIKDYSDVLNTPLWEFGFEFEIDLVIYNHGLSGGGQIGALREAIMRGQSVVRGHLHSDCYVHRYADKSKKIFGMQVGAGCDDDSYAMAYGKYNLKKSTIGCGIVFNGKSAIVELMDI